MFSTGGETNVAFGAVGAQPLHHLLNAIHVAWHGPQVRLDPLQHWPHGREVLVENLDGSISVLLMCMLKTTLALLCRRQEKWELLLLDFGNLVVALGVGVLPRLRGWFWSFDFPEAADCGFVEGIVKLKFGPSLELNCFGKKV